MNNGLETKEIENQPNCRFKQLQPEFNFDLLHIYTVH